MLQPKLSKVEFQVMEFLWTREQASIREIQEALSTSSPAKRPPAYTTVQTVVYRMEEKGVVERVGKIGNFHVFRAVTARDKVQRRLLDEFLGFFGGTGKLVMAHLIEAGELTLEDVKEAEDMLKSAKRRKSR